MMDLKMPTDLLNRLITNFGNSTQENRQIAKRLNTLLPIRLKEIKQEHSETARSAALAERLALTDERYQDFILELNDIKSANHLARMQYETHLMLVDARSSLRALRRN